MGSLSREAPEITVYVNGVETPLLRPIRTECSVGARRPDYCTLERDMGAEGRHVQDLAVGGAELQGIGAVVEVVGNIGGTKVLYHYGKATLIQPAIGGGERIQ